MVGGQLPIHRNVGCFSLFEIHKPGLMGVRTARTVAPRPFRSGRPESLGHGMSNPVQHEQSGPATRPGGAIAVELRPGT